MGQNSHWLVETYFTPCMIGAIAVPINFRLSESEMLDLIADCPPGVLIVDRHFQDRAADLMRLCPSLKHLIFADWDAPADGMPADTIHYDTLLPETPPVANDAFVDRASKSDDTMTLVPTMLSMIMDHPEFSRFDFSSIRCLTYGASPMPVKLMERALDAIPGIVFCQGYGMTETSPVLTVLPPADHVPGNPMIGKLASVGKPMIYAELRVVDEDDTPVPTGQPGEVLVRGPQVMNGYWNRPDDTAHAMRGGFYHTGDAGYLDKDGYLFLVGRTKEMIISGGENIYPIETENALSKHAAVAQCTVLGLPHPHWGKRCMPWLPCMMAHPQTKPI